MTTQEVKRKLTAILSADVKGYSRLMGEDEEATVRTLNGYKEVMTGLIQHHHGRVVDATGDNLMAEFASVVDAVESAVEIQKELKTRNAELPENRKMEFRIGINLGDVIEEEGRIYGDGVNVAARLEGLSKAGGICISGTAFDQVRNKLDLGYEYLGEQTVKNIAEPIRVYRVLMEPEAAGKVIGEKKVKTRQWQMATMGLVIGVIVVAAAVVIWKVHISSAPQPEITPKQKVIAPQPEKVSTVVPPSAEVVPKEKGIPQSPEKVSKTIPPAPKIEVASKERMAFLLPDKPSVAVLPFVNLSGDPGQDFLVDGITENIITALSSVPQLFVIARNSTFTYKGKAVKVQKVAEELGVRYVLEGSILRSGDRIRVTAQLIDALKGHHLWAERYDRELKDLFALQDDLTMKILKGVHLKLTHGEQILHKVFPRNLEVFLKMLQGLDYLRQFNINSNNRARLIAEECIDLESDYWAGYLLLGSVHMMDYWLGSTRNPAQSLNLAIEYMEKTLALPAPKGRVLDVLGHLYVLKKDYDKAIELGEQAIALIPNGADAHAWLAMSLNYAGKPEQALPLFEKAIRLNPLPPAFYYLNYGNSFRLIGRFEEAIVMYKKSIQLTPNSAPAHYVLAATYGLMGREEEAKAVAAELLRINPKFSVEYVAKTSPYKRQENTDQIIEGLRKAGLK
jgi:adenylate cyclase